VAATAATLAWRAGGPFWAATIALALVAGTFAPASAWVLRELVDHLTTPPAAVVPIVVLTGAAVLLGTLSVGVGSLSGATAAACQRRISVAVTADLFAAVNRIQGLRPFERPGFQDDLRLAERAAEETPAGITSVLGSVLQGGGTVAGYAGLLIATWPPMVGLMAAACVPAAVAQVSMLRRSAQTSEAMVSRYRQWFLLRGLLSDPRAVAEVRLLGLGEFFRSRLVAALRTATGAEYEVKRRVAVMQCLLSGRARGPGRR
jgi:ATP-binding cassette subfamily B protein